MAEAVDARVGAIPRRQPCAGMHGRRPRRAVRIVGARHVALERCERYAMCTPVLAPDLVHQDMAARLEWPADGHRPAIDARKLAGGIVRGLDVQPQQTDIAAELRLGVVDLRALPEPRLLRGALRTGRGGNKRDDQADEDEAGLHAGSISAAGPTLPTSLGMTSSTLSRAQKTMSSSRPGGPYVRAFNPSSALGNARATRSAAIAASERSASSNCTMRPAQYASSRANAP